MLRVLAPASRCVLSCSCRSLKLAATDLKKGTFFDGSALGQPSSRIFKVLETSHVKPGKGAGIVHAKVARTAHTHTRGAEAVAASSSREMTQNKPPPFNSTCSCHHSS